MSAGDNCGRRDDAAESAGDAEPCVIRDDQQHIGRILRRHDTRRPPRLRLQGLVLDHAEFGIKCGKLFAIDRGRGPGRTGRARDLWGLGQGWNGAQCHQE